MTRFTTLFAASALGLVILSAPVVAAPAAPSAGYAVGPQYDTTHVYVPQDQFDAFVTSFSATFGGTTNKQGVFQVTPTTSLTKSQLVLTPAGSVSVFGFKTPIPYPSEANEVGGIPIPMPLTVNKTSPKSNGKVRPPYPVDEPPPVVNKQRKPSYHVR